MVVYQYVCRCHCRYVGRTSLRLHDGIPQHIQKTIRNKSIPLRTLPTRDCKTKISTIHYCNSAIGSYLLQNDECTKFYNDQQFSILAKARTQFHLATLGYVYMRLFFVRKENRIQFFFVISLKRNTKFKLYTKFISFFFGKMKSQVKCSQRSYIQHITIQKLVLCRHK